MARRVTMRGDRELRATLRRIGGSTQGAALDGVMVHALEPLRNQVRTTAPRVSLRRDVVIAKVQGRGSTAREFWVSFKRGLAMRIAHLVELGTAPHSLAAGASRRKGIMQDVPPFHPGTPPEPFMRPAFESQKDNVEKIAARGFFALILAAVSGRS